MGLTTPADFATPISDHEQNKPTLVLTKATFGVGSCEKHLWEVLQTDFTLA